MLSGIDLGHLGPELLSENLLFYRRRREFHANFQSEISSAEKYNFLSFVHLETGFLKDRQCKCHVETQDAISEPPFAADSGQMVSSTK